MFIDVEHKFNNAEHKFNDAKHKFNVDEHKLLVGLRQKYNGRENHINPLNTSMQGTVNTSRNRLFCKINRILFGQVCYYQYLCTPKASGKAYRWLPFIIYF